MTSEPGPHTLLDCLLAGDADSTLYYRRLEEATPEDWPRLLDLAEHADPAVRRGLVGTLPLLAPDPAPEWVERVIELTTDPDLRVRDHACFVLGQQWREVDTAAVREALAARLDDLDRDTRCEALLGLAYRHDERALPRVRAALARASGDLRMLELIAAGALGEPGLHSLVQQHLDGWDEEHERTVEAVDRLTDPAGPGADLFAGVAALYAARAAGGPDHSDDPEHLAAWQLMLTMLDIAPERAKGFYTATAARLSGDEAGLAELRLRSALAVDALPD